MVESFTSGRILASGINTKAAPGGLLCEWQEEPLGVDNRAPRLSWQSQVDSQSHYRIQVASSQKLLRQGKPDLWDSGKVASALSVSIPYAGKSLRSRQVVYWRVRVWAESADASGPWSQDSRWEMGLLSPEDWKVRWIQAPVFEPVNHEPAVRRWTKLAGTTLDREGNIQKDGEKGLLKIKPAALFMTQLSINKTLRKARLYSAAAGYFEIFFDGRKLGQRVMNPAQTEFEKRILYDTDDVTWLLPRGEHIITVHLGEGFYGQGVAFAPRMQLSYGAPSFILQLELEYLDGSRETIGSDRNWLTKPSPVVKNNIYAGEVYDARRAGDSSVEWLHSLVKKEVPTKRLESQKLPRIKAVKEVKPICIFEPEPNIWVFDFGQNFTGVPTLSIKQGQLPAGNAVFLRFSEWADEQGAINQLSGGERATKVRQVDAYISKGAMAQSWTPAFTWHGFRYIEVTGLNNKPDIDFLTAHQLRSSVERRGKFESSDAHLNRVHAIALWTYESNLMSLPMDCPIRERCGWTGDAHATVAMSNYNFHMPTFWEKYLGDFRTSNNFAPNIVPGKRDYPGKVDWAVAQIIIVWEHYLNYASIQTIENHYEPMVKFMDAYHQRVNNEGFIDRDLYGDWCDQVRKPGQARRNGPGCPQHTSPALTGTALFIYACDILERFAQILKDDENVLQFQQWRNRSANAFHEHFYKAGQKSYGSQTADAMALSFEVVPAALRGAVEKSLNKNVLEEWNGHASSGALGQPWLYPALTDAGYTDTAYGIFHAEGFPGFHYLFDTLNGTTLWENISSFDPVTMPAPKDSLSHPFKGGYDTWFYRGLGGIMQDPNQPGFKHFFLKPVFPKNLDWAKVALESPYGMIQSQWERKGDKILWEVQVPLNTTATVQRVGHKNRTLGPGNHVNTFENDSTIHSM